MQPQAQPTPYRDNVRETIECSTCGAALDFEPGHRTANCAYCASPNVIVKHGASDTPDPTFALAFVLPRERAVEIARKWVKGRWFAPSAFQKAAVEEVKGVYLPTYIYSARAVANYSAQIGEHYTVTETYTDSKGNVRTRTRTETEWRSLSGTYENYVSDMVVTASKGIPNDELEKIEPFDMRALHRYSPKLVSGWIVEEPSLTVEQCSQLGRREAESSIGRALSRFMPGDKHRALQFHTTLLEEDTELTAVPIWVLPVRYAEDKPFVRLLVNGQTGRITGKQPWSWVKITAAILTFLGVCFGFAIALGAFS